MLGGVVMRNCNRGGHPEKHPEIRDYGREPFVFNVRHATNMNRNFRIAPWTGEHIQLTLMSIPTGGEIGTEMHHDVDQFIRVESGRAKVYFGDSRDCLHEAGIINENYAILIPAGTWHNVVNIGNRPLKVYSLYEPPNHPFGTIQQTKADDEH